MRHRGLWVPTVIFIAYSYRRLLSLRFHPWKAILDHILGTVQFKFVVINSFLELNFLSRVSYGSISQVDIVSSWLELIEFRKLHTPRFVYSHLLTLWSRLQNPRLIDCVRYFHASPARHCVMSAYVGNLLFIMMFTSVWVFFEYCQCFHRIFTKDLPDIL